MKKIRLDLYLINNNLVTSREIGKRLIMAGLVSVNERVALKGSMMVKEDDNILIKEKLPFVSRGGYKLDKAMKSFKINVKDLLVLDVGASTGGFTDCLLQNGAKHVYSIDVGYGQLHWKLRTDDRVSVHERTNARYINEEVLGSLCHGAVCDASFISLTKLIDAIAICTYDDAFFLGLIKPQFEAGKGNVGKGGVIRDPKVHTNVIITTIDYINTFTPFNVIGLDYSPIKGPKGNIEFLIYCKKAIPCVDIDVEGLVKRTHQNLIKTNL